MEVKDYRIGNLIYKFGIDYVGENPVVDRNDFEVIEVDLSVLKNIIDYDGTTDFYYTEPIPLTEEWLLKFGFIDGNKSPASECERWGNWYKNKYFMIEKLNNMEFGFDSYCGITIIKYVHQLQNFYFALTEKELTPQ